MSPCKKVKLIVPCSLQINKMPNKLINTELYMILYIKRKKGFHRTLSKLKTVKHSYI